MTSSPDADNDVRPQRKPVATSSAPNRFLGSSPRIDADPDRDRSQHHRSDRDGYPIGGA